ncbi:hypothetical protein B2M20_08010 [Nitrobacter vulgaris]|uniref:Uncharacterized protein n=1 Tax=Nitrobacter vulgaris TaxID=29421 RepID=A0A1V4HZC1_NITVU|nr:hypothetical protein B2M20_08010 [Nitrobacter vulgaris]
MPLNLVCGCEVTWDASRPFELLIEADFSTREARRDIAVRREILWESGVAPSAEVLRKKREFIIAFRANHLIVGYNRNPRYVEWAIGP